MIRRILSSLFGRRPFKGPPLNTRLLAVHMSEATIPLPDRRKRRRAR